MKIVGPVIGCMVLATAPTTVSAEPKISVHAAGTASGGYTDNALSAPDNPGPGDNPRESDLFTELAPSALVVIDTPRSLSDLSYGVRILLFARRDGGNSLNHQGDWRGMFLLSPLSQLTVNARVRAGQTNALATDGSPDASRLGALPFGENDFIAIELEQELRRQLTPRWSLEQTAVAEARTAGGNGVDTRGVEAGAGFGGTYTRRRYAVGARLGARYIDLERASMAVDFNQRAVLGDLRAVASRDLGRRWNVRAEAGARLLASVDGSFSNTVGPLGLASASYVNRFGEMSLTARHSLEPNLFVARNSTSDSAILRTSLPLPVLLDAADRPRLAINGTAGVQRLNTLALGGGDSEVEGVTTVLLADAGVSWLAVPDLTVNLRYQYRRQRSDDTLEDIVPSFTRNTVILSVVGVYPRRSLEQIEQGDSRTYRLDERKPVLEGRE